MKIMHKINDFILEKEFELRYYQGKINVINYEKIVNFNNNLIKLAFVGGFLSITGKDLAISRLFDNELLISGTIKDVEFEVVYE